MWPAEGNEVEARSASCGSLDHNTEQAADADLTAVKKNKRIKDELFEGLMKVGVSVSVTQQAYQVKLVVVWLQGIAIHCCIVSVIKSMSMIIMLVITLNNAQVLVLRLC